MAKESDKRKSSSPVTPLPRNAQRRDPDDDVPTQMFKGPTDEQLAAGAAAAAAKQTHSSPPRKVTPAPAQTKPASSPSNKVVATGRAKAAPVAAARSSSKNPAVASRAQAVQRARKLIVGVMSALGLGYAALLAHMVLGPFGGQPAMEDPAVAEAALRGEDAVPGLVTSLAREGRPSAIVSPASYSPLEPARPAETRRKVKRLVWPMENRFITSAFGSRLDPVRQVQVRQHRGVDVRSPCGMPVAAASGGTVVFAQKTPQSGTTIKIAHGNGWTTRYAHLARKTVKQGDRVEAGQVIGLSGATGRVTGAHLHFEIWKDDAPRNPMHFKYQYLSDARLTTPVRVTTTECGASGTAETSQVSARNAPSNGRSYRHIAVGMPNDAT